jgi:hypothetical protein
MIALVVFTDGRECLHDTIAHAHRKLDKAGAKITRYVLINDHPGIDWMEELTLRYAADGWLVKHYDRIGFCGVVKKWWEMMAHISEPFVFHLEDDFVIQQRVSLARMAFVLGQRPDIKQVAIKRTPHSREEIQAGGVIEQDPDAYTEDRVRALPQDIPILTHRKFWTTNPSLYRSSLAEIPWPNGPLCESKFSRNLFEDEDAKVAYLGTKDSQQIARHVGPRHKDGCNY